MLAWMRGHISCTPYRIEYPLQGKELTRATRLNISVVNFQAVSSEHSMAYTVTQGKGIQFHYYVLERDRILSLQG